MTVVVSLVVWAPKTAPSAFGKGTDVVAMMNTAFSLLSLLRISEITITLPSALVAVTILPLVTLATPSTSVTVVVLVTPFT